LLTEDEIEQIIDSIDGLESKVGLLQHEASRGSTHVNDILQSHPELAKIFSEKGYADYLQLHIAIINNNPPLNKEELAGVLSHDSTLITSHWQKDRYDTIMQTGSESDKSNFLADVVTENKASIIGREWLKGSDVAIDAIETPEMFEKVAESLFLNDDGLSSYYSTLKNKFIEEFKTSKPEIYALHEAAGILSYSDSSIDYIAGYGDGVLDLEEVTKIKLDIIPADLRDSLKRSLSEATISGKVVNIEKLTESLKSTVVEGNKIDPAQIKQAVVAASELPKNGAVATRE